MFEKLMKVAVIGATLLSAAHAAPASATVYMRERTYYSDATYAVQVGYWMNNCQMQVRGWGEVTPYYVETLEACGGAWPP